MEHDVFATMHSEAVLAIPLSLLGRMLQYLTLHRDCLTLGAISPFRIVRLTLFPVITTLSPNSLGRELFSH